MTSPQTSSMKRNILIETILSGIFIFGTFVATSVFAQTGSMSTLQNVAATYAISMVPGAAQKTSPYHYYPPAIAVPTGTTVAWFNNDFGQPHTVTSGRPSGPDSGAEFNSGIMPASANSFFQFTFDKGGDYTYYCMIHPWRLAIASVSDFLERGSNFEFRSGVGQVFNLTKDFRTLLDFKPLTIPLDKSTPILYNVTILKNGDEAFSKTFVTSGEKLSLELIQGGNETRSYGPDFSSTGAYHVEGAFLKGNADYNIIVEISAINSKPPANTIEDEFNIKTVGIT
jgi:plastocyanin